MSYEIIIKETKMVKKLKGGTYQKVGEKEVKREPEFLGDENEPKTRMEPVYDYTKQFESIEEETTDVFSQKVEELDFTEVIKAINGIK